VRTPNLVTTGRTAPPPGGRRRGISLLETSIVVVVLAILMTVTLPALRPSETERLRAAADLLAAATMTTRNGQLRMEASSARWTERANLIQEMDDSFEARLKLNC
jgi:Tfp pilus assembly protein FimT